MIFFIQFVEAALYTGHHTNPRLNKYRGILIKPVLLCVYCVWIEFQKKIITFSGDLN